MSLFGFGKKYDDGKIEVLAAETAGDNPIMQKYIKNIKIKSEKGVVTLEGAVDSEKVKKQIEKNINEKLTKSRIDFKSIENKLEVEE